MKNTMTYLGVWMVLAGAVQAATVVYETTSPYHHIQVIDRGRLRTLHFDNSWQSRMSLDDPLQGHFEYTEYFHMPWLWNDQIKTVLFIGLGGSSIQRAYQAYYPQVKTETVELDPKVVEVAKAYFHFQETEAMQVVIEDGRVHLRRSQKRYDLIVLDAYTANRYGSYIPYSLVTREFFNLAKDHLTDNGILAYNVIGRIDSRRETLLGSLYKTLDSCFSSVSLFPAAGSDNVVLIAAKSDVPVTLPILKGRAETFIAAHPAAFPNFLERLQRLRTRPPAGAERAKILTDDFAPVDGLMRAE